MGKISGLFISNSSEIDRIIGEVIYFGEVLGKFSEIYGPLDQEDLTVVTEDQGVIDALERLFNSETLCGYNPIEYYQDGDK